jgi:HD-GYP domain-containing protein (c-di-GMP phosphodiesterase class II)
MAQEQNKKLIKMPIKDFAKKIICDGHLYVTYNSRRFYVMRPGIFVDSEFIKKYAITDQVFEFEPIVSEDIKDKFKNHFRELKLLKQEKLIREKCKEIIKLFFDFYSSENHFLTFALACYEEFCLISLDTQEKMHEIDLYLFRKSLYASSFSVIIAMVNDFFHYSMLRDFYNLTFCLDIGLCEKNYSYYVAVACNYENQKPGAGLTYLEAEGASPLEKRVFLNHPEKSYEFITQSNILSYPELAEIILYQHELSDGSGFPRGITKSQVSSWEAVTILSDSMVEIIKAYHFEANVVEYMSQFKNSKVAELPIARVYKKLKLVMNYIYSPKEVAS